MLGQTESCFDLSNFSLLLGGRGWESVLLRVYIECSRERERGGGWPQAITAKRYILAGERASESSLKAAVCRYNYSVHANGRFRFALRPDDHAAAQPALPEEAARAFGSDSIRASSIGCWKKALDPIVRIPAPGHAATGTRKSQLRQCSRALDLTADNGRLALTV